MSYLTCDILQGSENALVPEMALIVYTSEEDCSSGGMYIESHMIDSKGRLGAGAPLSQQCISDLASSFSSEQSVSPFGKIPPNMLYSDNRLGHQKYIWYNPPKKQHMYFKDSLAIPNGEYHIPGIIYVAHGERLDVYAFKGKKPENKLFKAPFFNTTDGSVCLGSAKLAYPLNPSFDDIIRYWEQKFWNTEFTHLGGGGNPTKNNLVIVTKNSKEKFNEQELIEMNITLKSLLK